jgi:GNAT superfamily N-acetyltransferase
MTRTAVALEAAEMAGHLDLFRAAPRSLARRYGIVVREFDGVLCTAVKEGGLNPRLFNHVFGFGLTAPATEALLARIERFFADVEAGFCVFVSPGSDPATELLRARGYADEYPWVKFRRGGEPDPPAETTLRIVPCAPGHREALGHTVAAAFGFPAFFGDWLAHVPGRSGWHCFVGLDGADVVAAGGLFVQGPSGWAAFGSTRPAHRGRGGQSAIFAARVRAARDLGCSLLVTETGEAVEGRPSNSYRNIVRAGFERAYVRQNLRHTGSVAGVS